MPGGVKKKASHQNHQSSNSEPQKFLPTDVVILVMGGTGSCRSTFINALLPGHAKPMKVGDPNSIASCTMAVEHRIIDTAAFGASGNRKSYRLILVDTPGFNRDKQPDSGVFHNIADWSGIWLPDGGCRLGVVILHDATVHFNHRLDDNIVASLRKYLNMVIATSKWDRPAEAEGVHDSLVRKWGKPPGEVHFHRFKQDSDAHTIMQDFLSQVENGKRMDFSSIFHTMAAEREKREAKRESGFRKFFRSLAFWKS